MASKYSAPLRPVVLDNATDTGECTYLSGKYIHLSFVYVYCYPKSYLIVYGVVQPPPPIYVYVHVHAYMYSCILTHTLWTRIMFL